MNRSRSLAPLVAAALLASCNGSGASVSGSAGESAKSDSGMSSLAEQSRGLSVDNARTVDMPALGLMADAFVADSTKRGLYNDRLMIYPLSSVDGAIPRLDTVVNDSMNPGTTTGRSPLDTDHAKLAAPIVIALQPRRGWEVNPQAPDPVFNNPFFRRSRAQAHYDPVEHRRYMEALSAATIYTNDVFALIGQKLGGVALVDPDAAKARVVTAFQSIPPATLRALLKGAVDQVTQGHFTTDLTGSDNIHFVHSDAGDFVGDARGTTWTKAGGVWFGDGRINGQAVNLRLASTASLAERQSETTTAGASSSSDVSGSGSVGPGK